MQNNELTVCIFSMQLNMCRVGKGKRPQSDIMWPPSINHSAKDRPRWFKMICLTHTSVLVLSGKEAFKVWHTNRFYKCFLKEKKKTKNQHTHLLWLQQQIESLQCANSYLKENKYCHVNSYCVRGGQ